MCYINKLNNINLIRIELGIIFIACILHTVFSFLRNKPNFNTYALFNSSPFFNFSINADCHNLLKNVFHTWGGWKAKVEDDKGGTVWSHYDVTNITKINGKDFCYNYISYKDLLYNGQIIKNGTECPKEYNKSCGRIDTLNQKLCIKENENCPLYEVGIGLPPDKINYIYDKNSSIYYNKDNFNITNKTIIGKLILNDGQPCYQSTEKLWRQFSPIEVDKNHLNCTNIQIFGKISDDRYIEKGEITYKKLYEDNLNENSKNIVINKITNNEKVHVYKMELFGIDKKCDEKFNLTDNFNSFEKIQGSDKTIQSIEGILIGCVCIIFIIIEFCFLCQKFHRDVLHKIYFWFFIIYIVAIIGCFSYHIIAYRNMVKNDYSYYNCSDSITNEIIKKGNENNKKLMKYNMICTFLDGIIIAGNLIAVIIGLILDRIDKNKENKSNSDCKNSEEIETPFYDESK